MKNSSFIFLQPEYPELFTLTELAEKLVSIDPNSSLTKTRLFVEKLVLLMGEFERYEFSPRILPIYASTNYTQRMYFLIM